VNKEDLRIPLNKKRLDLSEIEVEKMSKSIHDLLFSRLMMHRYSPIHFFFPLKRKKEPNTRLIINTLRKDFAPDIYISKSIENGELLHVLFEPFTKLETNHWGIEEPTDLTKAHTSQAFFEKYKNEDILVFTPLLAFDKKGNRVGYGKGYYDRFLQYATKGTTIVGLSFFEPVDSIDDVNQYDVKMNYCVTPERVWAW
jgi:5-formyltetrahydrofolate cyclo-ligase